MKNFQRLALTAIALGAFVFPLGCQHQAKPVPQPVRPAENLDLTLMKAVHAKDLPTVKNCVKRGADVNVKDPSGWSAGMWAVWHWFDDKPLCAYVMHSGGEFAQHQKDNLLERAARTGDADRAEAFIALGANPNYVNAFGENCATLALRYFRGQYGIPEDDKAKPRYGDLGAINASIRQNTADLDAAEKRLAEILDVKKSYENAAELFEKSPHDSADDRAAFDAEELAAAKAFAEKTQLSVPATASSAPQIYAALEVSAKKARDAAYGTLRQTRFLALLKEKGANLRALLAGTQDDSGKQDHWKGQQDKWTVDPVARYGVSRALPAITDGLWDGELALIQLIGRGDEIFYHLIKNYEGKKSVRDQAVVGALGGAVLGGFLGSALGSVPNVETQQTESSFSGGMWFDGQGWNNYSGSSYSTTTTTSSNDFLNEYTLIGSLSGALLGGTLAWNNASAENDRIDQENQRRQEQNEKIFQEYFEEIEIPQEEEYLREMLKSKNPVEYAKKYLRLKEKYKKELVRAAKEFLDYGADVNARANCTDAPALVCAVLWEKPEFEELLLSYGADRKLALFYVCERNDFDLLKKLLPRITDVSGVPADAAGDTILHRAVRAGRADLVGELVKRGAAVNARNKHADTPLHLAAEIENEACVRALLENGADVRACDKDGRMPFQRFWNVPNPALTQIFVDAHYSAPKK